MKTTTSIVRAAMVCMATLVVPFELSGQVKIVTETFDEEDFTGTAQDGKGGETHLKESKAVEADLHKIHQEVGKHKDKPSSPKDLKDSLDRLAELADGENGSDKGDSKPGRMSSKPASGPEKEDLKEISEKAAGELGKLEEALKQGASQAANSGDPDSAEELGALAGKAKELEAKANAMAKEASPDVSDVDDLLEQSEQLSQAATDALAAAEEQASAKGASAQSEQAALDKLNGQSEAAAEALKELQEAAQAASRSAWTDSQQDNEPGDPKEEDLYQSAAEATAQQMDKLQDTLNKAASQAKSPQAAKNLQDLAKKAEALEKEAESLARETKPDSEAVDDLLNESRDLASEASEALAKAEMDPEKVKQANAAPPPPSKQPPSQPPSAPPQQGETPPPGEPGSTKPAQPGQPGQPGQPPKEQPDSSEQQDNDSSPGPPPSSPPQPQDPASSEGSPPNSPDQQNRAQSNPANPSGGTESSADGSDANEAAAGTTAKGFSLHIPAEESRRANSVTITVPRTEPVPEKPGNDEVAEPDDDEKESNIHDYIY